MNQLEQIKNNSIIVADTGDISSIKKYQPQDATTNPSLILKAAELPDYEPLVLDSIKFARKDNNDNTVSIAAERLTVLIGRQISYLVPGVVSTEIDARLSFDKQAMIKKAQQIIMWYEELGVQRDRVLIKIAATWEGIQAARELEIENIHCNLTLLFNLTQARACADAKVYLISPFVGRITDWYKAQGDSFNVENDPGVLSVKRIFNYFRVNDIKTIVMAASFRNIDQIHQLNGCDRLTIAPSLLFELQEISSEVDVDINQNIVMSKNLNNETITESEFRWQMNQDIMASEKLADGIRRFAEDTIALESLLESKLQAI